MEKIISNSDALTFSLGLSISKRTGAVITIQYNSVILRSEEAAIQLVIDEQTEYFKLIYHPGLSELLVDDIFTLLIPIDQINDVDELNLSAAKALKLNIFINEIDPFISIPFNYYKEIADNGILYLDRFFTKTTFKKQYRYCIKKKSGRYSLEIMYGDKVIYNTPIHIILRNGNGNEDL